VEKKELLFGAGSDCEAVEGWSHKGNVFEGFAGRRIPALWRSPMLVERCHK